MWARRCSFGTRSSRLGWRSVLAAVVLLAVTGAGAAWGWAYCVTYPNSRPGYVGGPTSVCAYTGTSRTECTGWDDPGSSCVTSLFYCQPRQQY